ncbi:DNA-directed RNA polymerase subunit beta [Bienertia sinuspersici]
MACTPIVRQKVATNPSSKAKTGKRSTSKHNPSDSKSKKTVPASAKDKRKEVDINYYDIDFNATLEFLSSLKVHMFPNPSSGGSSITFQLFNEDHTWTLEKFNEALGIPIGGPRVTPQHWNEKELWRTINVELNYDSKRSSVTSICHPALRCVFKVFSNSIFGRQEGSKVRKDEIFMLHHMLHATPIDTRAFLIHQLQSTANNVNTGGKLEQLIRDGFVDGTDAVEVPPSWFKKKDGTTLWRIQNDEDEIPSPKQMTLRNKANWSFNYSSRSVHVPLLPEPSMSALPLHYDGDPSSPSPTTSSCASL